MPRMKDGAGGRARWQARRQAGWRERRAEKFLRVDAFADECAVGTESTGSQWSCHGRRRCQQQSGLDSSRTPRSCRQPSRLSCLDVRDLCGPDARCSAHLPDRIPSRTQASDSTVLHKGAQRRVLELEQPPPCTGLVLQAIPLDVETLAGLDVGELCHLGLAVVAVQPQRWKPVMRLAASLLDQEVLQPPPVRPWELLFNWGAIERCDLE